MCRIEKKKEELNSKLVCGKNEIRNIVRREKAWRACRTKERVKKKIYIAREKKSNRRNEE